MTVFDLVALFVICTSGVVGYARGGVREIVTLVAFGLAALSAVFVLPVSGFIFGNLVHPRWLAAITAICVVFVLAYVAVRMLGGALTDRLRAARLGGADRSLGATVGIVRALVVLGLVSILLESAPWPDGKPGWFEDGLTYPLARVSGRLIARLAPAGGAVMGGVTHFVHSGVARAIASPENAMDTEEPPLAARDESGSGRSAGEFAGHRGRRQAGGDIMERAR